MPGLCYIHSKKIRIKKYIKYGKLLAENIRNLQEIKGTTLPGFIAVCV